MKNTKNTTLGRKATFDQGKNEGLYKPRRTASQSGDGADFAFNGQMGNGVNREDGHYNGRHAGNQMGLTMRENFGRGPTKGNTSNDKVPNTTAASGKINGGTTVKCFPHPDAINVGMRK